MQNVCSLAIKNRFCCQLAWNWVKISLLTHSVLSCTFFATILSKWTTPHCDQVKMFHVLQESLKHQKKLKEAKSNNLASCKIFTSDLTCNKKGDNNDNKNYKKVASRKCCKKADNKYVWNSLRSTTIFF